METEAFISPPRLRAPVLPTTAIRTQPEDFEVEEIPSYAPGEPGEHLFLWVEKRDVSAGDLVTRLARVLDIKSRDIGVAGQKDRRAVTRQFLSVPHNCLSRVTSSAAGEIRILSATPHSNKLRTGHVDGNKFRIVLRPEDGTAFTESHAQAVRERLSEITGQGFPNYFGPQRFGHNGSSVRDGISLLQPAGTGKLKRVKRHLRKLLASAVQSAVFNCVLANRVKDHTFNTPQSGDVVCSKDGIRPFLFDERGDTPAEGLVPMGPLPGAKMMASQATVHEQESQAIQKLGLDEGLFCNDVKLTPGTRRRFVDYPTDTSAQLLNDGSIETRFVLSSGAYATVMLSEVCDIVSR